MTTLGAAAAARPTSVPPPVAGADVLALAEQLWFALLGEEELLLPAPAPGTGEDGEDGLDGVTARVDIDGPWRGSVAVHCAGATAERLARTLLRLPDGEGSADVDRADVDDSVGELANVLGGNVKAMLPGASVLSLPVVERGPRPDAGAAPCRLDLLWRDAPVTVLVWGTATPGSADSAPSPSPDRPDPREEQQ